MYQVAIKRRGKRLTPLSISQGAIKNEKWTTCVGDGLAESGTENMGTTTVSNIQKTMYLAMHTLVGGPGKQQGHLH